MFRKPAVTALLLVLSLVITARLLLSQEPFPSGDEVRAVVVLSRHGVRAPLASEIRGSVYNAQTWPSWSVGTGVLTEHGAEALRLLGNWYRGHYASLFSGDSCEARTLYAEANTAQRTVASAKAILAGLKAGCEPQVAVKANGQPNPLFGPDVVAGQTDPVKLSNAIRGRLGGQPDWWTRAFAEPLEEMRHVLLDCDGADCDKSKRSLISAPAVVAPAPGRGLVSADGPVAMGADFAEHFLLQYTEGLPMEKVGWGRVSPAALKRLMEMNTRYHDFVLRTPYYAQVAGSDLAFRIDATLRQGADGHETPGALGTPASRFILLGGHDSNLTWLGGLLRMDWLLPDETFNATPPGSALVFELLRKRTGGEYRVRAIFVAQTLDQIRSLKPLTAGEQPAMAPIFIPGCSEDSADFSCPLSSFSRVVEGAIDKRFLEPALRH